MTDAAGVVVWQARYDSFGNADIQVEAVTSNLRFPGQYYDAETGLHYNFNRYYDPRLGRYLRTDPLGLDGGDVNLYAYCMGNPVTGMDVMGLEMTAREMQQMQLDAITDEELAAMTGNPGIYFPQYDATFGNPYYIAHP